MEGARLMGVGIRRVVMILTRDYTPGSASLGTANGLAELVQSLAMTVGPTIIR